MLSIPKEFQVPLVAAVSDSSSFASPLQSLVRTHLYISPPDRHPGLSPRHLPLNKDCEERSEIFCQENAKEEDSSLHANEIANTKEQDPSLCHRIG